ncbi:DUF262 domain-containing protein [Miniphocaeibacter halophilus]|uniref:DUF262 domain-containing protein n=1 Tax=Miniphocaeibacter halophilus TaxID=2931922 RepID=A0AC61MMN3_9FIRM|nr:DUF262 domain-containing protein [Miniphocaeibacter halophilus]QQK06950.1 DUF262 domain-containing protein [Miniphocaeibacter halophilus]
MSTSLEKNIQSFITDKIKFIIPSYQRGYRWSEREVIDLLNDLKTFTKKKNENDYGQKYCLQPLVVKKEEDNVYIVVDGQQRLTTVYILLICMKEYKPKINIAFEIEYEVRNKVDNYIEELLKGNINDESIDSYFIKEAFANIKKWLEDPNLEEDSSILVDDLYKTVIKNMIFLWYDVENENPIKLFQRINMGKIPLTNSELIKALYLKKDNYEGDYKKFGEKNDFIRINQIQLAYEWDLMEKKLQDDDFWFFFNNQNIENRIEYILKIYALNEKMLPDYNDKGENSYALFYAYNQKIENEKENLSTYIENSWNKIKSIYMFINECYQDSTIYHYLGFIFYFGTDNNNIKIIIDLINLDKNEIVSKLKRKIKEIIKLEKDIDDLNYIDDTKTIKKILLLHNILTLVKDKSFFKFPFNIFKNGENGEGGWDIEHINANVEITPGSNDERIEWLKNLPDIDKEYEIQEYIKKEKIAEIEFDKIYKKIILKYFGAENLEDNNKISNLALLDSYTNRAYKNAVFPKKREVIIENDKNGRFIPICTKNVFLKYYSNLVENKNFEIWTKDDRESYLQDIKNKIETIIGVYDEE